MKRKTSSSVMDRPQKKREEDMGPLVRASMSLNDALMTAVMGHT